MLKKSVSISIGLMILFGIAGTPQPVQAQSELFFGQHHSYNVTFRGNGEAVVFARLIVTNTESAPMKNYTFEVPGVIPSEMIMYQQILPRPCVQYALYDDGGTRVCSKYDEPDYQNNSYSDYYYSRKQTSAEYKKLTYTKTENVYKLDFADPLEPNQTSAIVLAYTAHGYVKKSLGLYTFAFETIKVPSRIQDVRVAVDVDSDLFLKGKEAQVQYEVDYTSTLSLGAATAEVGLSSPQMDKTVRGIGTRGALIKEAKNLAPNESFRITGKYAASKSRLALFGIMLTILIILAVGGLVVFLAVFAKRKRKKHLESQGEVLQPGPKMSGNPSAFGWRSLVAGAVSAGVVFGITFFMTLILARLRFLERMEEVFLIAGFIALVLLYILAVFGPALWLGSNHGRKTALVVLMYELLGFLLFFGFYLIFIALTS